MMIMVPWRWRLSLLQTHHAATGTESMVSSWHVQSAAFHCRDAPGKTGRVSWAPRHACRGTYPLCAPSSRHIMRPLCRMYDKFGADMTIRYFHVHALKETVNEEERRGSSTKEHNVTLILENYCSNNSFFCFGRVVLEVVGATTWTISLCCLCWSLNNRNFNLISTLITDTREKQDRNRAPKVSSPRLVIIGDLKNIMIAMQS